MNHGISSSSSCALHLHSLEITPREGKKIKRRESLVLFDRRGGVFTKSARTKHPQTCPDLLSWDNITVSQKQKGANPPP